MPNTILIPSAQNLPDGFCPQTWQSTVDAFAAAMRVTLPTSASQIVISQTAPPPAEQDRIWFQVDANNHVLAIKSFDQGTGDWERVDDIPYYFNDIGSANSLQITTGDSVSILNDIGGRLFIIKASAANTSTTPTLTVDGCPVTVIKKNGSEALQAGNIAAGMLCIIIYDGTQFQLLNPKYVSVSGTYLTYYNQSSQTSIPANASIFEWNHGITGVPSEFGAYLVCQVSELGYSVGDRVPFTSAQTYTGTYFFPTFTITGDANKIVLTTGTPTSQVLFHLPNKSTGAMTAGDTAKWNIVFYANKFVAA